MTNRWSPVSTNTTLRAWAVAEVTCAKDANLAAFIAESAPGAAERVRAGQIHTLNDADWHALEQAIFSARAPLLKTLLDLGPQWYEGQVALDDLAVMRFMNFDDWPSKWPSRTF